MDSDDGEEAEGDKPGAEELEMAAEMAAIHRCCMSLLIVDRMMLPLCVTAELLDAFALEARVKRAGVCIDRRLVGVLAFAAAEVVAAADADGSGGASSFARVANAFADADADMLFDRSLLFNQFFLFSSPATVDFLRPSRGLLSG